MEQFTALAEAQAAWTPRSAPASARTPATPPRATKAKPPTKTLVEPEIPLSALAAAFADNVAQHESFDILDAVKAAWNKNQEQAPRAVEESNATTGQTFASSEDNDAYQIHARGYLETKTESTGSWARTWMIS